MGKYVQVVKFDLKKMGHEKGMCEKNVRLGYGLPAKCPDAKADMEYNKKMKALHPISTLPKNVDVPVFVDTASVNEHIEASVKGVLYSDGSKVINPNKQKFFGWGEFCAKARVVKYQETPAKIKVGDTVIVNGQGSGNSKGGGGKTRNFKNQKMKVIAIQNSRYGCNQYNKKGAVTGWWTKSQVKKV